MTWLRARRGSARWGRAVLAVLVLGGSSLASDARAPGAKKPAAPSRAPPEARTGSLAEPGYLPALARDLLHRRMKRHGKNLVQLVGAVTLLEHDKAREVARLIATEPRISRPVLGSEDALNTALPPRFFELQDALRQHAKAVEQAAAKRDDAALGAALGELTRTCVACHSVYLNPPPSSDGERP